MDKSFTSWREPTNDKEDSEIISEDDSSHESDLELEDCNILVPDSDESYVNESNDYSDSIKTIKKVIPDSDESLTEEKATNEGISDTSLTSLEIETPTKKNNRQRLISESDSETNGSSSDNDSKTTNENKSKIISDSSSSSPEIRTPTRKKNKQRLISDSDEEINGSRSDDGSQKKENTSTINTIDLTLPIRNDKKTGVIDLTNVIKRDSHKFAGNTGIILIDSDSEDRKCLQSDQEKEYDEQLSAQVTKINFLQDKSNPSSVLPKQNSSQVLSKKSENDYASRIESLVAEETRLKVQVSEILKNIDSTKSTLRSANLTALPDRGVRLQINLKNQESKLRDLRYQQHTLSNEILRLQLISKSSTVPLPKPQQSQPLPLKMFKLPTTNTDLNEMGKRAMETHRTQQALTVDALRALHNSLKNCPSEDTLASDPVGLSVELMPHQKHALSWLLWRESEKPSGGILADDMGLGKTLTMISLILKSNEERQKNGSQSESEEEADRDSGSNWLSSKRSKLIEGKTLVVCPASLTGQWEGEVKKRLRRGTIDVLVHHGQNREKIARRLARPDLVITTYNIVSRDANNPESPIFQVKWQRVILDEAHQIRNYKTKTAEAVFRLKAKSRWTLTGTPVQNKELDLFALIKFLRCSPFDDLAVWKRWVDNRDAAGTQRLNTIIKSIMLRRTKKGLQEIGELIDLKEKKLHTIFITMDKEELAIYEKLLHYSKTLFAHFLHQKAEKENALTGIALKPTKASNYLQIAEDPFKDHPELARLHRKMMEMPDVKSHHILVLLLRLRQFCCHPSLVKTMLEKDDISNVGIEDEDGLDLDLLDKFTDMSMSSKDDKTPSVDTDITAMNKDNPLFAEDRLSSKLRKVLETIEGILASEDKLLVVSQWVSLLNLVHKVLQEKKIKCISLTGQVQVKDRAEVVEKFNRKGHNPRVMLLSLTAGGVGLNLVGGNHLLLLDLHWNPQLESQACDRIYRVGQEKDVQIYKFVTSESIEEKILLLQEKKLGIADGVLTGTKHTSKLSLDDLKMLFQIK